MSGFYLYYLSTPLFITSSFITKEQLDTNGLELLEELDEPLIIPKPKRIYKGKKILDSLSQDTNTFYGIKNEDEIPIRNIEIKSVKENPTEILFHPSPLKIEFGGWQTIILIFALMLLGFAKAFSSSRFNQTIKALVNYGVSQEINREEKIFFHRVNILLTTIHILVISLFIYQLKDLIYLNGIELHYFVFYLFIIAFVLSIYFIKYILSLILSFIFDEANISSEYIFNISLYNNLLGVLLIPVLCIYYFTTFDLNFILFYLALPLLTVVFFLRLIRLYLMGLTKGISYFYIFLYICTLEIIPLVVLFKIFIFK
jgi:hypothetical protein